MAAVTGAVTETVTITGEDELVNGTHQQKEAAVPLRIELDPAVCTGHGRCYALAAEVFGPDEEGNGTVLKGTVETAADRAAALTAQRSCPEGAITLVEQG
jgi:ferredoxin